MRLSQLSAPADVTRIADLIRAAVRTPGNPLMGAKVTTRFDRLANGWCVRLVLGTRFPDRAALAMVRRAATRLTA